MDNHSGKINIYRKNQLYRICAKCFVFILGGVLLGTFPGCGAPEIVKNSDRPVITEDLNSFVNMDNNALDHDEQDKMNNTVDARVFLESTLYYSDIRSDEALTEDELYKNTVAGIIPHHTVAHEMIRNFYAKTSRANTLTTSSSKTSSSKTSNSNEDAYDLIIVISPNHSSKGARFQVTTKNFLTYDGVVYSEKSIARKLIIDKLASEATDEVIINEHGQLVHMNYISHYFKSVPVLNIMINETRDYEGIEVLRDEIVNLVNEKRVLYIASIDFSHYLTLDEANEKDEVTKSILISGESRQLISKSNDYIDSPSSFALLIELLNVSKSYEITNSDDASDITHTFSVHIIEHNNSAVILKDRNLKETTSYFSVLYTK